MAEKRTPNSSHSKLTRIDSLFKQPHALIVAVAAILLGIWAVTASFAAGTTTSPSPNLTANQCGQRVQNYSYTVPFGNAPWNTPVCNLPKHPQSADYASRLFNHANWNDGSAQGLAGRGQYGVGFGFQPPERNWGRAVYYASDATTTIQAQVCGNGCYPSNLDDNVNMYDIKAYLPDRQIPWNPTWTVAQVSGGGDNELIIIDDRDPNKHIMYSFAAVKVGINAVLQCGPFNQERLCASEARVLRDSDGKIVDMRSYEGSAPDRGVGISYYATLLTPQEIQAGEIRHALGMVTFGTAFGPECSKAQLGANNPAIVGVTCGTAVAPASKFEWPTITSITQRVPSTIGNPVAQILTVAKTVPEGMRFALNVTDSDIDTWINSRADLVANPRKAETARIIARALKDYGWMIVDTSGAGSTFQASTALSAKNKTIWNQLGVTQESDDNILSGLFTDKNIYVLDSPTNNCIDGTQSKYYCPYRSSRYPNVATPAPTATPTPQTSTTATKTPTPTPTVKPTPSSTPSPAPTIVPAPTKTPTPGPVASITPIPPAPISTLPSKVSLPSKIAVEGRWDWKMFEFHQAALLNWTQSTSSKGIKNYVVLKNSKKIYEGANNSFEDFGINAGQRYRYEIYAVDNAGNRSAGTIYEKQMTCIFFGLICGFQ